MAKDKEKKEKNKEDELPDLGFIFDERGEYWCDIANHAIMVKKGDQHDELLEIAGKLGRVQGMKFNSIIKDVDTEEAAKLIEGEGYIVVKAEEADFTEIQRELDKLLTIKGGESKKYK